MELALAAALACLAQDADYFPTKKGMTWTYVWDDKKIDKVTCTGTKKRGDFEYHVFHYDVQNGSAQRNEWFFVGKWEGRHGAMYCGIDLDAEEPPHDVDENPIVVLSFDAKKKGDTWKREDDGKTMTWVHEGEEEVSVPAGKYRCVRIRRDYELAGEKSSITSWYAKGVGLVKSEELIGKLKSTMELKEVK